jgi:hypothetical protein
MTSAGGIAFKNNSNDESYHSSVFFIPARRKRKREVIP